MDKKIVLALLGLLVIVSNIIWLKVDNRPQQWDQSSHLMDAEKFLRMGPAVTLKNLSSTNRFYTPFVPLAGAVSGKIFGNSADGMTYSMIFFQLLMMISVFLFTRKVLDDYSGLAAAAVSISFPFIIDQGHSFMFDLPLASITVLTWFLILKSKNFNDMKYSVILGFTAALGMLTKLQYFIYVLGPLLFAVFSGGDTGKQDLKKKLINFTSFMAVFCAVSSVWYMENLIPVLKSTFFYGFQGGGFDNKVPGVFTMDSALFYFLQLPSQLSVLYTALFIVSALLMFKDRQKRGILLYVFVPVILLLLIRNKQYRYILPVFPAIAAAGVYFIYRLQAGKKKAASYCVAIAAACLYVIANTVPNKLFNYDLRPQKSDWNIKQNIETIIRDSGGNADVCIISDAAEMNWYTYMHQFMLHSRGVKITEIKYFPKYCDYLVAKTGLQGGPISFDATARAVLTDDLIGKKNYGKYFEKISEYGLPDGRGYIFKRINYRPGKTAAIAAVEKELAGYVKYRQAGMRVSGPDSASNYTAEISIKSGALFIKKGQKEMVMPFEDFDFVIEKIGFSRELELMNFGQFRIKRLVISAEDIASVINNQKDAISNKDFNLLSPFIRYVLTKMDNCSIGLSGNTAAVSGEINSRPAIIKMRLCIEENIMQVKLERAKIGKLDLPVFMVSPFFKPYSWVLNNEFEEITKTVYSGITADKGKIIIE